MRFGVPCQLHSDQGPQFESKLIAEVCKLLGIQKSRTTPYHPQCDGMVERFNRTLLNMLATHCKNNPWNWEEHLQKVCFAYNTSIHTSTGYSPYYLMFGRQPVLPIDVQYGTTQPHQQPSVNEYAAELDQRLTSAFELARRTSGIQHERQKQYYDTKTHGESHAVGDLVWLHNPKVPKNSSKKLFHPWTGPFKVVKKLSEYTYRIQKQEGRRLRQVVHFNRLKPCPRDIRLDSSSNQQTTDKDDDTSAPRHNDVPSAVPPPIGTNLEVVDNDEDDFTSVHNQWNVGEAQNTDNVHTSTELRRYPTRQHRPPARFQDYVRS